MTFEVDPKREIEIRKGFSGVWIVEDLKEDEILYRGTDRAAAHNIYKDFKRED